MSCRLPGPTDQYPCVLLARMHLLMRCTHLLILFGSLHRYLQRFSRPVLFQDPLQCLGPLPQQVRFSARCAASVPLCSQLEATRACLLQNVTLWRS